MIQNLMLQILEAELTRNNIYKYTFTNGRMYPAISIFGQ